MSKKKSKLKLAQEKAEATIKKTNIKINELGKQTADLYNTLNATQDLFDQISNVPTEKRLQHEELKKVRLNWKQQAEKIEADYKNAVAKNAGKGAAGVGVGVAVAALGPTAAMGVATTFGVASTGTAISTLSGAAATNAALAWLGGGTLAAGGGGMVAGKALLALAGPIGWAIAGVALLGSGLLFWKAKTEKDRLEDIFTLIAKRDTRAYELAIVELNERIVRIQDESDKLKKAIEEIKTFGIDYELMSEAQQYSLGAYLNLMVSSTQLLINPILGLQTKFTEEDFDSFIATKKYPATNKSVVVFLANLLYKIELTEKDKKLLWKSFRKNKKMLESLEIKKKEFDYSLIEITSKALAFKK